MAEPTEERWDNDAPITAAQYAGIWDSAMAAQEQPSYSRNVVRKLLAEIDRLRDELREWQSGAENEWGYGDGPDDVDPIGDRNAARDCAQAYGAHVFVRSTYHGPWRKDG